MRVDIHSTQSLFLVLQKQAGHTGSQKQETSLLYLHRDSCMADGVEVCICHCWRKGKRLTECFIYLSMMNTLFLTGM